MTKRAAIIVIVLLALSPVALSRAAGRHEVGIVPPDNPQVLEKSKEGPCDCCQKCQAAKSDIKSKESEKEDDHTNGCEDCCAECGKELKPTQQANPPEVIEKNIPPEVKEHKKGKSDGGER